MSKSSSGFSNSKDFEKCGLFLDSLLDKILLYQDEFKSSRLDEWKERILELSKKTSELQNKDEQLEIIMKDFSFKSNNNDNLENVSLERRTEEVKETLRKRIMNFDPTNSGFYKRIKSKISPDDNDDDLIITGKSKEIDFKCPFTGTIFVEPMKNENCIHHISKIGLESLLKNKPTVNCPVSGCVKKWTKASASLDTAFQFRIERFQRSQLRNTQLLSQLKQSEALDVEG